MLPPTVYTAIAFATLIVLVLAISGLIRLAYYLANLAREDDFIFILPGRKVVIEYRHLNERYSVEGWVLCPIPYYLLVVNRRLNLLRLRTTMVGRIGISPLIGSWYPVNRGAYLDSLPEVLLPRAPEPAHLDSESHFSDSTLLTDASDCRSLSEYRIASLQWLNQ